MKLIRDFAIWAFCIIWAGVGINVILQLNRIVPILTKQSPNCAPAVPLRKMT